MLKYDVIVLGSGCGLEIVEQAAAHGLTTALIEPGALGGTCLNLGCIPSKMLIAPADLVAETERAARLGVKMSVQEVDFPTIMHRMRHSRAESQQRLEQRVKNEQGTHLYSTAGEFIKTGIIQADHEELEGKQIFIAAGARPLIPPIHGLEKVDYLTNESVLELEELPKSIIILGGGYIAVEFAHFFAAMGSTVTIIEMADRLVTGEEPEISRVLQDELSRRVHIVTGMKAESVSTKGALVTVTGRNQSTNKSSTFEAESLMVALGRRSNADILHVERADIKTNSHGFIEVDEYMNTTQSNVYAIGDINGRSMFRHSANVMALVGAANAFDHDSIPMDYSAIPHAVYSYPQIASVGLTEAQAKAAKYDVITSITPYTDVAKGEALDEQAGFAKAIVDKKSERILGFHIIGPSAPVLIQEVVNAMKSGGNMDEILRAIHIHPSLTELIPSAFADMR
ncbi:MAG: dihydrolipoyl dehydrogenase [Dehalococcoidia bacterium]|nr:dihydrolipoyl dehydrogenase [Dehalococcoidia bacterium]